MTKNEAVSRIDTAHSLDLVEKLEVWCLYPVTDVLSRVDEAVDMMVAAPDAAGSVAGRASLTGLEREVAQLLQLGWLSWHEPGAGLRRARATSVTASSGSALLAARAREAGHSHRLGRPAGPPRRHRRVHAGWPEMPGSFVGELEGDPVAVAALSEAYGALIELWIDAIRVVLDHLDAAVDLAADLMRGPEARL